jgi:hypothetical protein
MASWLTGICEPRIFELHEWGPSVVTDATEFEPLYNGAEGCWFDTSLSWIVYASHEASISFAGTVRSSVESLVPESPRPVETIRIGVVELRSIFIDMGTWGTGIYDNDDAADWSCNHHGPLGAAPLLGGRHPSVEPHIPGIGTDVTSISLDQVMPRLNSRFNLFQ